MNPVELLPGSLNYPIYMLTLTKIGNTFLLKEGTEKVVSSKDAMMVVNAIRKAGKRVDGIENLPVYYRNMIEPVLTEDHVAQLLISE